MATANKIELDSTVEYQDEQWTVFSFCPESTEYNLIQGVPGSGGGIQGSGVTKTLWVKQADLLRDGKPVCRQGTVGCGKDNIHFQCLLR
jgi:hypothetical protein